MPVSRGGGRGRQREGYNNPRTWTPIDAIYHDLQIENRDAYDRTRGVISGALEKYLRKYKGKSYDGLTPEQQTEFLLSIFAGSAWHGVRDSISRQLSDTNRDAIRRANDAMPEAFAEGANLAAWNLHRSFGTASGSGGGSRGGGSGRMRTAVYEPPPYTEAVVAALAAAKLITLAGKTINRTKDVHYIVRRLQAIVQTEALMHTPVGKMPSAVSRRLTDSIRSATEATARSMLDGAYDSGVYEAGLDAARAGYEIEKTWLGIPDMRIRDSHRHLHGTTLPLDELFRGYAGSLRYPHDPEAPLEEIMRCRCRMVVHFAGQAPDGYAYDLKQSQVGEYRRWRDQAIHEAGDGLIAVHKAIRRR